VDRRTAGRTNNLRTKQAELYASERHVGLDYFSIRVHRSRLPTPVRGLGLYCLQYTADLDASYERDLDRLQKEGELRKPVHYALRSLAVVSLKIWANASVPYTVPYS